MARVVVVVVMYTPDSHSFANLFSKKFKTNVNICYRVCMDAFIV